MDETTKNIPVNVEFVEQEQLGYDDERRVSMVATVDIVLPEVNVPVQMWCDYYKELHVTLTRGNKQVASARLRERTPLKGPKHPEEAACKGDRVHNGARKGPKQGKAAQGTPKMMDSGIDLSSEEEVEEGDNEYEESDYDDDDDDDEEKVESGDDMKDREDEGDEEVEEVKKDKEKKRKRDSDEKRTNKKKEKKEKKEKKAKKAKTGK